MVVDRRRFFEPGYTYHVVNRGVQRQQLFFTRDDYIAFEQLLLETFELMAMAIFCYQLMPNHWHFSVCPATREQLAGFFQRLSSTHAKRFRRDTQTVGEGHVYQDRFKSFPIQSDAHFLTVNRYIERNAVRANLVERAQDWQFGSLWRREFGDDRILAPWPIQRPADWTDRVNQPLTKDELEAVRRCTRRGTPYGDPEWVAATAGELQLEHTLRDRGRPRKFSR